ncbi:thiol:disulfide interchange protein DsbD [Candidatus Dependentiae bacterium Noda2021]|nr:thiol:disulfide interchange protein DsbD [Candidatus Dependentiae bacterium Noda2021]
MRNTLLLAMFVAASTSIIFPSEQPAGVSATVVQRADQDFDIACVLPASAQNLVYADSVHFSFDNPALSIKEFDSTAEPIIHFDSSFKENKKAYNAPAIFHLNVSGDAKELEQTQLHVTYYSKAQKKMLQEIITLSLPQQPQEELATTLDVQLPETKSLPLDTSATPANKQSITDYISNLIQSADSRALQLVLVFILGILMSLTPCIYPMIPITAGVLQAQGSKSVLNSFMLTLSYTMGIATTFAFLGLLASYAGQAFGSFMTNPFVVCTIVALLIYLAFSMLGMYEMHIPRFLQPKNQSVKGGSCASAFIFGAVSGTVASPCLSPGLVLLLSIVSTLGSKFLGFMMLFVFGFGLSVPLLLIGTFSSSLSLLPRTGMWMIEVKRIFGFLLLAMCFYFMNNLLPWYLMLWGMAFFVMASGIFYLYSAQNNTSYTKATKNMLGILLLSSSVMLTFKSYQETYAAAPEPVNNHKWYVNYAQARKIAQETNKKLFVDIGASFCSICKAIDREILSDDSVFAAIENHTIPVKIDGSDSSEENYAYVRSHYKVIGFPTIYVIDPHTETVIKKWGPELYQTPKEQFIKELSEL